MKPLYKCEICGFKSEDPREVLACENCHLKADEVKVIETYDYTSKWPVPRNMLVQFPDGAIVEYRFNQIKKNGGECKE